MSGPVTSPPRRPLQAAIARRSRSRASRGALARSVLRSVGLTVLALLLAAPFAAAWGIGHARIEDYLGPHRVTFASNYLGEVEIDLGPIGNAYLPSPRAPVGLSITVGGVGSPGGGEVSSFFSEATLAAYAGIVSEPQEAVAGVVERLQQEMLVESVKAEVLLLALLMVWMLRRQLLAPWLVRSFPLRWVAAIYALALALMLGSLAAPPARAPQRIPVTANLGPTFHGLTVDSPVLSDLLDRGIKGVKLLTRRQRKAVDDYVLHAGSSLAQQLRKLPEPRAGESMLLGFGDLHCNQAMTRLIKQLAVLTQPAQVLDSGDDTVNGTAAERFCITREAGIGRKGPFLVSTGNHDSAVTELQMSNAHLTVLDGKVVHSDGLSVLGDDDPERQVPFSTSRVQDRSESEGQLGQRLVRAARGKDVDVILVHQPAASVEIMTTPNPPARLVLWGHYHQQGEPSVIPHDDGTWTVGMQQATAGGVREPTFTSFSTPFSPPLISADVYFYFRDDATGLVTGVQAVHFLPEARVVVSARVDTGDPTLLLPEVRDRLKGSTPAPTPDRHR